MTGDSTLTAGAGSGGTPASSLTVTDNGTIELGLGSGSGTSNSGLLDLHASSTNLLTGSGTIIMSAGISNQVSFGAGSASNSNTIASGILIQGQHGVITEDSAGAILTNNGTINANVSDGTDTAGNSGIQVRWVGSSGSGTNNGTIEATNGGSLTLGASGTPFTNNGSLLDSGSGSTLWIGNGGPNNGVWTSPTGTISLTSNATLDLGGQFTQGDLANFTRDSSATTVNLAGRLNGNLTLNNTLGSWNLGVGNIGGTLYDGTFSIAAASTAQLFAVGAVSTLDDMTIDSPIVLSSLDSGGNSPRIQVADSMVLNTTLDLGSSNTSVSASLNFVNSGVLSLFTQSVTGTGTIVAGGNTSNTMNSSNTSLTIGSGITIEGQNVSIQVGKPFLRSHL